MRERSDESKLDVTSRGIEKFIRMIDEALRTGEAKWAGEVKDLGGIRGSRIECRFIVKTLLDSRPEKGRLDVEDSTIRRLPREGLREPMTEIFDQEEYLTVVTELGEVSVNQIGLKIIDDKLIISVDDPSFRRRKKILLPTAINPEKIEAAYRNGVLQVRVKKL